MATGSNEPRRDAEQRQLTGRQLVLIDAGALGAYLPGQVAKVNVSPWTAPAHHLDSLQRLLSCFRHVRSRLSSAHILIFVEAEGHRRLCSEWRSASGAASEIPSVDVHCVPFGGGVGDFLLEVGRLRATEGYEVSVVTNLASTIVKLRSIGTRMEHLGFMFVEGSIVMPGLPQHPGSADRDANIAPVDENRVAVQRTVLRRGTSPPLRRLVDLPTRPRESSDEPSLATSQRPPQMPTGHCENQEAPFQSKHQEDDDCETQHDSQLDGEAMSTCADDIECADTMVDVAVENAPETECQADGKRGLERQLSVNSFAARLQYELERADTLADNETEGAGFGMGRGSAGEQSNDYNCAGEYLPPTLLAEDAYSCNALVGLASYSGELADSNDTAAPAADLQNEAEQTEHVRVELDERSPLADAEALDIQSPLADTIMVPRFADGPGAENQCSPQIPAPNGKPTEFQDCDEQSGFASHVEAHKQKFLHRVHSRDASSQSTMEGKINSLSNGDLNVAESPSRQRRSTNSISPGTSAASNLCETGLPTTTIGRKRLEGNTVADTNANSFIRPNNGCPEPAPESQMSEDVAVTSARIVAFRPNDQTGSQQVHTESMPAADGSDGVLPNTHPPTAEEAVIKIEIDECLVTVGTYIDLEADAEMMVASDAGVEICGQNSLCSKRASRALASDEDCEPATEDFHNGLRPASRDAADTPAATAEPILENSPATASTLVVGDAKDAASFMETVALPTAEAEQAPITVKTHAQAPHSPTQTNICDQPQAQSQTNGAVSSSLGNPNSPNTRFQLRRMSGFGEGDIELISNRPRLETSPSQRSQTHSPAPRGSRSKRGADGSGTRKSEKRRKRLHEQAEQPPEYDIPRTPQLNPESPNGEETTIRGIAVPAHCTAATLDGAVDISDEIPATMTIAAATAETVEPVL